MEDYEDYRKNTTMLEKKAIYIGAICTYNLTDPLAKFRLTIDLLIRVSHLPYVINARFILRLIVVLILYQNCANGFYTSKWSFLSGKFINLYDTFFFFYIQIDDLWLERRWILPSERRFGWMFTWHCVHGRDRLHIGRKSAQHKYYLQSKFQILNFKVFNSLNRFRHWQQKH